MKDNNFSERVSEIMKKSAFTLPFGDFEETVMYRIKKAAVQKKALLRDKKLSFLFFILGTTLGLVINFSLQNMQHGFMGISAESCALLFQGFFVLFFLTQLERFVKLFRVLKKG